MIGETIGFLLRNLPAVLLVAALVLAALRRGYGSTAERFLAWILLLPIGVTGLWAGLTHVFFPTVAAAHIGWQTSPFQFEVGMADLAVGITACLSFWQDLSFKAAASRPCPCCLNFRSLDIAIYGIHLAWNLEHKCSHLLRVSV